MHSEQLKLELRMPWDGHDPRSLTRAALARSLASEGTGRSDRQTFETLHVGQMEFFPEEKSYGP